MFCSNAARLKQREAHWSWYRITFALRLGKPQHCSPTFCWQPSFSHREGTQIAQVSWQVAGQPSQCMRGKIDSRHWDISRLLTTQWLAGTLILPRISIAHYKQILNEIHNALIHSLIIRSIFFLLKQLQKQNKWFWKHSLPHQVWAQNASLWHFCLASSAFRINWVYPGKELPYLRVRLWNPHCICCVCGALGPRLARPLHCFSAGWCFSFFCL